MLDDACIEVGRAPHTIQRSVQIGVDYDDLPPTLVHTTAARGAGFTHIVLSLHEQPGETRHADSRFSYGPPADPSRSGCSPAAWATKESPAS